MLKSGSKNNIESNKELNNDKFSNFVFVGTLCIASLLSKIIWIFKIKMFSLKMFPE